MNAEQDNWELHWEQYADAATQNPAQQMRHGLILSLFRSISKTSEVRIFDIGSGQGDLLKKLRRQLPDASLLGTELSIRGVELSKKKVPDATLIAADIFQPNEQMEAFRNWATHATCSEVLEHLDNPVQFLKAARFYLADNAEIIVTVPGGPMSAFDKHIGHRQHFTKETIGEIVQDAGFEITRIYRAGFPFFNLYRITVIARGSRLVEDVNAKQKGVSGRFAKLIMLAYHFLFRLNIKDSPMGWQLVVIANKSSFSEAR